MPIIKIILMLIFAALGIYILVRIHKSSKAIAGVASLWEVKITTIAPRILPPETDWLLYPYVPARMGWYYTRHKMEERMKFWTGRAWKYNSSDTAVCFYQDCDFKGLTKRVTE